MKIFLFNAVLSIAFVAVVSISQVNSAFSMPQNEQAGNAVQSGADKECKIKIAEVKNTTTLPYKSFHQIIDAAPTEYLVKVLITAKTTINNCSIVALEYVPRDTEATAFRITELYSLYTLTPEKPLVLGTEFPGSMPQRGIVYTDTDGSRQLYCLVMSGEDSSVLLSKAEIYEQTPPNN